MWIGISFSWEDILGLENALFLLSFYSILKILESHFPSFLAAYHSWCHDFPWGTILFMYFVILMNNEVIKGFSDWLRLPWNVCENTMWAGWKYWMLLFYKLWCCYSPISMMLIFLDANGCRNSFLILNIYRLGPILIYMKAYF